MFQHAAKCKTAIAFIYCMVFFTVPLLHGPYSLRGRLGRKKKITQWNGSMNPMVPNTPLDCHRTADQARGGARGGSM